jgi:hypothetical protein
MTPFGDLPQLHSFDYAQHKSDLMRQAQSASQSLNDRSDDFIERARRVIQQNSMSNQLRPFGYSPQNGSVGQVYPSSVDSPTIKEVKMSRRMVQIFIGDPDERVPVEKSLIHKSEPIVTDLTDQELFYELDLKNLLKSHNEYRTTVLNKKVKDRTEHLEPVRIKDLSMLVITMAEFRKP